MNTDSSGRSHHFSILGMRVAYVGWIVAGMFLFCEAAFAGSEAKGRTDEIIATRVGPRTLSTTDYESSLILSPDGQRAYVTRYSATSRNPSIFESRLQDGVWGMPQRMSFSTDSMDSNPCFSPDGQKMVFMRREPRSPGAKLWVSQRQGEGWSAPQKFGLEVAQSHGEQNLEWLPDGSLYFTAFVGEQYDATIFRSSLEKGAFTTPIEVEQVNSRFDELSLCVAKDSSFMIFSARGRYDSAGEADLYISLRQNGKWTAGRNLGSVVNTAFDEINPRLSPDGQRLFFSRGGELYEIPVKALLEPSERSLKAWKPCADMPKGWVWTRNVTLGDNIYVMGGVTAWGKGMEPVTSMVAYSPDADKWVGKASLPTKDPMAPAILLDGKLVLFQRAQGAGSFEYNPVADTWAARAGEDLPQGRQPTMMAVVAQGRTYLASGTWANDQWIHALIRSDASLNKWEPLNSLPVSYYGSQMIGADKTLFLIGAGSQGRALFRYDMEHDSWTVLPSMPTGRIEGRGVEWKGHIIVAGGHSHGGAALSSVEMYDLAKGVWTRLPDLPAPRWGVSVAVCKDRLFVIGGCADAVGDNAASASVWEYVEALD